jgi:transcriptional regulator with XRE-family HTH domain
MITNSPFRRLFLREWREHRGLTQEQLGDRMGMSRPQISKIERGMAQYSQEFIEAAAYALRCEPVDLIMRDPTAPGGIWSIWEQIPEVDRPKALQVLEAFVPRVKASR